MKASVSDGLFPTFLAAKSHALLQIPTLVALRKLDLIFQEAGAIGSMLCKAVEGCWQDAFHLSLP